MLVTGIRAVVNAVTEGGVIDTVTVIAGPVA